MSDRAVVQGKQCFGTGVIKHAARDLSHVKEAPCGTCGGSDHEPRPRAIVAVSEDRQWLVVLEPAGYSAGYSDWFVRYRLNAYGCWAPDSDAHVPCCVQDIGQDAHEVLAAFLADQDA